MNRGEYRKKINRIVLFCYTVAAALLLGCYAAEVIKEHVTVAYFLRMMLALVVPLAISYGVNQYLKKGDCRIRYVIAAGMLVFYTFIMMTATSNLAFVFVIPMVSLLCIYADSKLVLVIALYTMVINVVNVIEHYRMGERTVDDIMGYEIQIGCMVASGLFLYMATRLMKQDSDRLFELSEGIEKDPLTGAYNRYFFSRNIEKMEKRAADRYGLTLAFIDVDNFREFNTEYGHELGDAVLSSLAGRMIEILGEYRETYLIRMGGDEFVIISSEYPSERFSNIMKRVKRKTDQLTIEYQGQKISVNISVGIANEKTDKCVDYLELYRLADKRLYEAKENGKNQIVSMYQEA